MHFLGRKPVKITILYIYRGTLSKKPLRSEKNSEEGSARKKNCSWALICSQRPLSLVVSNVISSVTFSISAKVIFTINLIYKHFQIKTVPLFKTKK